MLHLTMTTTRGGAVLAVSGSWHSADDADTMAAALTFVPVDDHVIVDLRELDRLSPACADDLCARLLERVAWSEVVVVATRPDVVMPLVLAEVDRVVPIVRTIADAVAIVSRRSGLDLQEAV
jgi:anti-anti-sigma regulatory factor